jgi:predicted esterase
VIGGRLPRRVEPQVEMPPALMNLRVLIVHAPDDDVLPPAHAVEAAAFLTAQEMAPTMRMAGEGHDLSPAAVRELRTWLAARSPH